MRGTVTYGLFSERLNLGVEWRFLGVEWDGATEKSKPPWFDSAHHRLRSPDVWGTQIHLRPFHLGHPPNANPLSLQHTPSFPSPIATVGVELL